MAALIDQPIMIFHVSTAEGAKVIRDARGQGLKVFAETCPQYLFLTADDLDKPGVEGAKWMCSPPPRRASDQEALWQALALGDLQTISSDHAPYRFDETGKLRAGPNPNFKQVANGLPGLEARLPLLFDAMVSKGRLGLEKFVELTATAPAKIYNLHPRKGSIAIGADADIAIWDPQREVTLSDAMMHDLAGYTPLCRPQAARLAGHRAIARARHRRGRQAFGRSRLRPLSGAQRRRGGETNRTSGGGHGSRAEFRCEAAVSCPPRCAGAAIFGLRNENPDLRRHRLCWAQYRRGAAGARSCGDVVRPRGLAACRGARFCRLCGSADRPSRATSPIGRRSRTSIAAGCEAIILGAAITAGPEREAADPETILRVNLLAQTPILIAARRHRRWHASSILSSARSLRRRTRSAIRRSMKKRPAIRFRSMPSPNLRPRKLRRVWPRSGNAISSACG